jgi:hypothetical protein
VGQKRFDNQVSVFVGRSVDNPALLCARVVNGQKASITFGMRAVRLERFWFGRFWSSSLRREDALRPRQEPFGILIGYWLQTGETRDFPVETEEDSIPPGQYRVRFGFVGAEAEKLQYVYSETFSLP